MPKKRAQKKPGAFKLVPKAATLRLLKVLNLKVEIDGSVVRAIVPRIPRGGCMPFTGRCGAREFFTKLPAD